MSLEQTSETKVKTTKTVFTIIELLHREGGASLTDVAEATGFAKSTVHNHLSTLETMGYAVEEGGQYHPGLRFLKIGDYVRNRKEEYDLIRAKVDELAEETQERAQFIISENGLGICFYTTGGSHAVHTEPKIGSQLYLHSSACGKAILANLSAPELERVIERWGLPALTENTISDPEELANRLETVRERGFSLNREENLVGLHAVGVSLEYPDGESIGALSVMGPTHRMKGEWFEEELPRNLLGTKNELELNIEHSIWND